MALNLCTTCYPLTLPDCPDTLELETDLAEGTYYVWVEDRFAIKYVQEVTVGVDGVVTVNATAFQAGMFTANSGHYIFTISTSETEDTQETFTIDASDYDCWLIKFEEVNAA
jgi:hypothetical protein